MSAVFARRAAAGSPVVCATAIAPRALNDGKAAFPENHNVYFQHDAYRAHRNTGEFSERRILVNVLQLTVQGSNSDGSRDEASGRGYFPGVLNGIDISVKDSQRSQYTYGWGFFNLGTTRHLTRKNRECATQGGLRRVSLGERNQHGVNQVLCADSRG